MMLLQKLTTIGMLFFSFYFKFRFNRLGQINNNINSYIYVEIPVFQMFFDLSDSFIHVKNPENRNFQDFWFLWHGLQIVTIELLPVTLC